MFELNKGFAPQKSLGLLRITRHRLVYYPGGNATIR